MSRKSAYSAEFKSKVVLDVLQGNKEITEIATEYGIHPNLIRSWKKDFVNNAQRVFDESKREKEIRRREEELELERDEMLKTIGQLTLERDFLQCCFRKAGRPVPEMDRYKK